ncbi:MAG: glycosyl hydrolase family 28 protein [Acutalibacteraceae bacterium]|nr:glycosyl hydrolase family 28 protein [Acutalibacteraceae bacterium]
MIKAICSAKKIVLYWDLPQNYKDGNKYKVYINGKPVGETVCCHLPIEDLTPDTEYECLVEMCGSTYDVIGKLICSTLCEKERIDITKPPYNAVGDGVTLNTKQIQKAIDNCRENQYVYIPKGDFMTGSLFLHSDMELYIDKDAVLHGTDNVKDYEPKIKSRFEGHEMMCYAALLNIGELDREKGYICSNVKITGGGTVCGGGRPLAENVISVETELLKDYIESLGDKIKECESAQTIPGRARPRLINVSSAQNVTISDITVMNGSSWNVHMIYSDNVVTYNCVFRSQGVWNGDGWDPDSSTNCTIFGSEFFTGDDAVAVKSGKNPEGNIINTPCEHIRIFDCISHFGHGITIGSEMSGGVNDVRIWNCDMSNSVYGVEIKSTKKRGGYVKNVTVKHSKVSRVLIHTVGYNDDGEAAPEVPLLKDCVFENLQIMGRMKNMNGETKPCNAIELSGFDIPDHFIRNVKFKDIVIGGEGENQQHKIILQCCEGVSFENISCF